MTQAHTVSFAGHEFALVEMGDGRWSLMCPRDVIADEIDWPDDDTIRRQTGLRVIWEEWDTADDLRECVGKPLGWRPEATEEERTTWALIEEGEEYCSDFRGTMEEALAEAVSNVDRTNYSEAEGTLWIDVEVLCEATGDSDSATVTLEPVAPDCADGHEHDWRSPQSVVGGCDENPGVWGHGGGIFATEVCRHCGTYRTTDTWAQRMDTGEQGLTSVSYREADDESLAWVGRQA